MKTPPKAQASKSYISHRAAEPMISSMLLWYTHSICLLVCPSHNGHLHPPQLRNAQEQGCQQAPSRYV